MSRSMLQGACADYVSAVQSAPHRHTTTPYVTGTSVVALKYAGGVMLAADMLGSYGSLARFMSVERIKAFGRVAVGGSGDLSDLQHIFDDLTALRTREFTHNDGVTLGARELWSYLTRTMYARRNKGDPLYNQLILAEFVDGKPFLAQVDLHGTSFEDDTLATGYGAHLARPILRNAYRPDLTRDEARKVVEECMRVLFYRDCRTINKVLVADVREDGVIVEGPLRLETSWDIGNRPADVQGSW